ncbi:hypothetical protein BJ742DRAFT_783069 [Cladochytrium replicatum]|nr:hypothetical protein BJ742DRAFT_783069 [Cladochytrium replicatum]
MPTNHIQFEIAPLALLIGSCSQNAPLRNRRVDAQKCGESRVLIGRIKSSMRRHGGSFEESGPVAPVLEFEDSSSSIACVISLREDRHSDLLTLTTNCGDELVCIADFNLVPIHPIQTRLSDEEDGFAPTSQNVYLEVASELTWISPDHFLSKHTSFTFSQSEFDPFMATGLFPRINRSGLMKRLAYVIDDAMLSLSGRVLAKSTLWSTSTNRYFLLQIRTISADSLKQLIWRLKATGENRIDERNLRIVPILCEESISSESPLIAALREAIFVDQSYLFDDLKPVITTFTSKGGLSHSVVLVHQTRHSDVPWGTPVDSEKEDEVAGVDLDSDPSELPNVITLEGTITRGIDPNTGSIQIDDEIELYLCDHPWWHLYGLRVGTTICMHNVHLFEISCPTWDAQNTTSENDRCRKSRPILAACTYSTIEILRFSETDAILGPFSVVRSRQGMWTAVEWIRWIRIAEMISQQWSVPKPTGWIFHAAEEVLKALGSNLQPERSSLFSAVMQHRKCCTLNDSSFAKMDVVFPPVSWILSNSAVVDALRSLNPDGHLILNSHELGAGNISLLGIIHCTDLGDVQFSCGSGSIRIMLPRMANGNDSYNRLSPVPGEKSQQPDQVVFDKGVFIPKFRIIFERVGKPFAYIEPLEIVSVDHVPAVLRESETDSDTMKNGHEFCHKGVDFCVEHVCPIYATIPLDGQPTLGYWIEGQMRSSTDNKQSIRHAWCELSGHSLRFYPLISRGTWFRIPCMKVLQKVSTDSDLTIHICPKGSLEKLAEGENLSMSGNLCESIQNVQTVVAKGSTLLNQLVNMEGRIKAKHFVETERFHFHPNNRDFGSGHLFAKYGIGVGSSVRQIMLEVEDFSDDSIIEVSMPVRNQKYPLGLIANAHVRFIRLQIIQDSAKSLVKGLATPETSVEIVSVDMRKMMPKQQIVHKSLWDSALPIQLARLILPVNGKLLDFDRSTVFRIVCQIQILEEVSIEVSRPGDKQQSPKLTGRARFLVTDYSAKATVELAQSIDSIFDLIAATGAQRKAIEVAALDSQQRFIVAKDYQSKERTNMETLEAGDALSRHCVVQDGNIRRKIVLYFRVDSASALIDPRSNRGGTQKLRKAKLIISKRQVETLAHQNLVLRGLRIEEVDTRLELRRQLKLLRQ